MKQYALVITGIVCLVMFPLLLIPIRVQAHLPVSLQTLQNETLLFSDTFERPDSVSPGKNWLEIENVPSTITITDQALAFDPTDDAPALASHIFPRVSTGLLHWQFDFDWIPVEPSADSDVHRLFLPLVAGAAGVRVAEVRTVPEEATVLMQLGDSSLLHQANLDAGVGVDLVWISTPDGDGTLGIRRAGSITSAFMPLQGSAHISVTVDMDRHTFMVRVNDSEDVGYGTVDPEVAFDTVRFATAALDASAFQTRAFDNLDIRWQPGDNPSPRAPVVSLTTPLTGTVVQSPATLTLTADAVDLDGMVRQVAFYAGDTLLGEVTNAPFSVDWTADVIGEYLLTAVATNDSGLSTTSMPVAITVKPPPSPKDLGYIGDYLHWGKVEVELPGPASEGMSRSTNPFKIPLDVTFNGPSGQSYTVPAFYDGDGDGGLDGNVWKVRFAPDQPGDWTFWAQSSHAQLDGYNGSFRVAARDDCIAHPPGGLPDFGCVGRLSYVGARYLGFADGSFFLKGGIDEPEDFLAAQETVGFASKEAAIDFLAAHGINSIYIMLHNVNGDRKNVWPWVGTTQIEAQANHEYFDVARLAVWEEIFSYIQSKGIVLHMVFEDDSAWIGFNRDMYYREMIARFGHHNGLYWNVGEEHDERYSFAESQSFAQAIRDLDAYKHPITVHNINEPLPAMINDTNFSLSSIQTGQFGPQNDLAIRWYEASVQAGRPFPVSFDEVRNKRSDDIGPTDANRIIARHVVWSVYLGGASFELYVDPAEDLAYADYAAFFDDITLARSILESQPYWMMLPANELLSGKSGYVLASPGEAYIVYLPAGGTAQLALSDADASIRFTITRINPRTGDRQSMGVVQGGSSVSLGTPDSKDWVFLVESGS